MAFQEVDIKTYKVKTENWLIEFSKCQDEIVQVNKAENAEIDAMSGDRYKNKFEEYVQKFPEKVEYYKQRRKEIKEKYGEYSSYYNCPYYCVVHNKEELDELIPEEKRGERSNYIHNIKGLNDFKGKKLQDECHKDVYGDFIGIVFFIDNEYWLIKDDKTGKEKFLLCADYFYGEREELPYRIVENGKDYL